MNAGRVIIKRNEESGINAREVVRTEGRKWYKHKEESGTNARREVVQMQGGGINPNDN